MHANPCTTLDKIGNNFPAHKINANKTIIYKFNSCFIIVKVCTSINAWEIFHQRIDLKINAAGILTHISFHNKIINSKY